MPNRMLRDWTQSDKIDALSCEAERFFTRLIMKVDDYGCFWADPRLVKANLFPLKLDKIREADMLRWMAECQKAGLIVLYEIDQKKYLRIVDFKQRLDRAKNKFPLPSESSLTTSRDSLAIVNDFPPEEKGSRIEVEVEKEIEIPARKNGFVKSINDEPVFYSIEHCLTVAMNDDRWMRANKITEKELKEFNVLLEQRGVYQKNPMDYKTHFANWKRSGKKEEAVNGVKSISSYLEQRKKDHEALEVKINK